MLTIYHGHVQCFSRGRLPRNAGVLLAPTHGGGELTETQRADALDRDATSFPTERNLWKLAHCADATSAIAATKAAPVVTVMPEKIEVDRGLA